MGLCERSASSSERQQTKVWQRGAECLRAPKAAGNCFLRPLFLKHLTFCRPKGKIRKTQYLNIQRVTQVGEKMWLEILWGEWNQRGRETAEMLGILGFGGRGAG